MVGAIALSPTDAASQEPVVGSAQRVVVARARAPRYATVQHCLECSCVQDILVTLCEENIMFWEVSGIGSEVIGLLWNLSFLEYSTGLFFLGLLLSFIVRLFSSPLGHSCF